LIKLSISKTQECIHYKEKYEMKNEKSENYKILLHAYLPLIIALITILISLFLDISIDGKQQTTYYFF